MSEPRTKSGVVDERSEKLQDLMIDFSNDEFKKKIAVLVDGEKRNILNNYEYADFYFTSDFNVKPNAGDDYSFVLYLGKENNLYNENSIKDLLHYIVNYGDNSEIFFADVAITDSKGNEIFTRCYRQVDHYNPNFHNKIVYNNPFVIKYNYLKYVEFDSSYKSLYLLNTFKKITKSFRSSHIPKKIFSASFTNLINSTLKEQELERIMNNEKHSANV